MLKTSVFDSVTKFLFRISRKREFLRYFNEMTKTLAYGYVSD